MTIIKFLAVGSGDMTYIRHGSSSLTIIDCCLHEDNRYDIINELKKNVRDKDIIRFISTHPDEDHISGIQYLNNAGLVPNFYVVENSARKEIETESFARYCQLRGSKKAFYVVQGCKRKWLNERDETRGSAGISMLWPKITNPHYLNALNEAEDGAAFNNMSLVARYRRTNGASVMWLGDLETQFMQDIEPDILLEKTNIVVAAHHGRESGKIPDTWLDKLLPDIIILGEAPSRDLNYYRGYNIITQNKSGDITMDCADRKVHFYVSNPNQKLRDWLVNEGQTKFDNYIGTLIV